MISSPMPLVLSLGRLVDLTGALPRKKKIMYVITQFVITNTVENSDCSVFSYVSCDIWVRLHKMLKLDKSSNIFFRI